MSEDERLFEAIANWLRWDKNATTRAEINDFVLDDDMSELRSRLLGRLAFGTAGMRARMEAGFDRLNDLVIIQTTQGLAEYVNATCDKPTSIVIGYDTRHNSKKWSRLAARACVLRGIKTYLFRQYVPTPFVPYAVVKLGASAGLMITASHNPKADNGYKVYWSNGAQIVEPRDRHICDTVLEHLEPVDGAWDERDLADHTLVVDPRQLAHCEQTDVFQWYYRDAEKWCCNKELNSVSRIKIAYTPFHGVGLEFALATLERFGFDLDKHVAVVQKQKDPDPEFSTVPFPNPEEGKEVLKLAMETAEASGCTLIFANDPDADRLQIAEKHNGEWRVLSGNEMGSLLAWRIWTQWRSTNPHVPASKVYFLNSTVSTKFVSTMAQAEGFNYEETLTGFKWMGNRTDDLRRQGFIVPLAWEESIGFMVGEGLDKDGVLAAAIFADYCARLYADGSSLTQQLHYIYHKYGYHVARSSYFGVYSSEQARRACDRIRYGQTEPVHTGVDHLNYPTEIGGRRVTRVVDLTVGHDSAAGGGRPALPVSASTQMVTFHLEGGSWCTVRASGTEPKLKYYVELRTQPQVPQTDLPRVYAQLDALEKAIVDELIKPKENGLKLRSASFQ